jgi:lipopolysaccharide export system permease protein
VDYRDFSLIIFRYLAGSVLSNTLGVTAILMLVVVSSRFVKYLAEAATGKLDASVLFAVIAFRLPGFLELVLPLAFFLSVLLAYGQLYVESEMTVLHACGLSQKKLIFHTLAVAALVASIVASLSLVVSPSGFVRVQELFTVQMQRGELESLTPGRFYNLQEGKGVTYAEEISADGRLGEVFLAQVSGEDESARGMAIVVAREGFSSKSDATGERYLVLEEGRRIQGIPGRGDFQITSFDVYGQRLASIKPSDLYQDIDAVSSSTLLGSDRGDYRAALQWRLSLPVLVMVVALMAVPLSRTNPRQGRFARILPAVLLYVIYLLALNAARGAVEEGAALGSLAMAGVHAVFLGIALVLVVINSGWRPPWRRPRLAVAP